MEKISKIINWHTLTEKDLLEKLNTTDRGLSEKEAKNRLKEYGKNSIPEGKKKTLVGIFFSQFRDPLIYVLIIAGVVVNFLGEFTDGIIIFFVLIVNSIVGTLQEFKARKTLDSLKEFTRGLAVVVRDGKEFEILDEELIPGDLIVIRDGYKVPADARLISVQDLKINESALTGESTSVAKNIDIIDEETSIPDRKNMIFKGTLCVSGQARAIVTETGALSYVGQISEQLIDIDTEMPLKEKIGQFSKVVGISVFIGVIFMLSVGYIRGLNFYELFFTATAVSVSLIPAGLPIVITLILARGVYKMAKRNALVKNMQAVEALGQANVIAVDKTGTITKNELMVERVYVDSKTFTVLGSGFKADGNIMYEDKAIEVSNHPEILFAGKIATFCSSASVEFTHNDEFKILGDPTEAALVVFGEKTGFRKPELESEEPLVLDIPFNFKYKFHATIHKIKDLEYKLSIIGAPESIISRISHIWTSEGVREINNNDKNDIYSKIEEFSSLGLRVLAFAYNKDNDSSIDLENMPKLVFGGLYAMADVLREEVSKAVSLVQKNDIRVVMITGDFIGTAKAIAREANIYKDGDKVITGAEIDILSVEELSKRLKNVSVFARVLPEHKLKIVEAYKLRGDIIGMTGDGVNDALSLQAAHLGIAMGKGGTDVAKDASDIVLLDNNFKSIIAAVEEGRSIYATIKKVVLYLISTSLGEFFAIAGSLVIGLPLPLYPSQILWLNLVTDGFMVVTLGFEPKISLKEGERGTNILTKIGGIRAILMSCTMAFFALITFSVYYNMDSTKAWTMALTVLAAFQWFNAWNVRSETNSAFYRPFTNKYLILGLFGAVGSHIFAVYNPFMQNILRLVPLDPYDWAIAISVASSILLVEEIRKIIFSLKR
jgi:P-type Ca2+ transporter type 2C